MNLLILGVETLREVIGVHARLLPRATAAVHAEATHGIHQTLGPVVPTVGEVVID